MEASDQQRALRIFQTNQNFFVDHLVKQQEFSSYYTQNGWEENLRKFLAEFEKFLYRTCLTVESKNATFKQIKPLIYLYRKRNFSIQDGLLSSQEFCHWLIEHKDHLVIRVYSNPWLFWGNYKKLDDLGLNPTEYAEYSDKVKSDPLRFEVNYQKLQRVGLNNSEYVTKLLDEPAKFENIYKKLQRLVLDSKQYVTKILDDPLLIEEKYKIFEDIYDMGFKHGAYNVYILESVDSVNNIIDKFNDRYDIFKRHEALGIVCIETISKVVAEGDFEFLSGMTRRLELIQTRLQQQIEKIKGKIGVGPRLDGLNLCKDEFIRNVLLTCFRFYMTKSCSDHYMDFKKKYQAFTITTSL